MNTVSSVLGGNYQDYLQGPGQWLSAFARSRKRKPKTNAMKTRPVIGCSLR